MIQNIPAAAIVVSTKDLPFLVGPRGVIPGRRRLEGSRFDLAHLSLVVGETAPGQVVALHRHNYDEVFIVHSGRGTYTVGMSLMIGCCSWTTAIDLVHDRPGRQPVDDNGKHHDE